MKKSKTQMNKRSVRDVDTDKRLVREADADERSVREADGSIKPGVKRSGTPGRHDYHTIKPAQRVTALTMNADEWGRCRPFHGLAQ